LRLVALTDLSGYLEPCGCQSRPLGGIDKAAAVLAALKADNVPLLFVSAGDLLFGERPEGASNDRDAAAQETWKAEALVDILSRLGLAAAAPGARDLSYGPETLKRLQGLAKFPWLPAGPADGTAPERTAGWLGSLGGAKVGVVGVSLFAAPAAELPAERLKALQLEVQAEIDRLRNQGAQLVVALISSDQRTGRRLSAGLRRLDFAVQGGVDDAAAPAPSRAGDTVLLRAGRQGQGLLVVDLYLEGAGAFADLSDWTRREQNAARKTRVDDLAQRVAAWERDTTVDQAGLREQRAKLAQLRTELARAEAPQNASGNAFRAKLEALGPERRGDGPIAKLVDAYDARVNEHNRVAFAGVSALPVPPGAARYLGSAACKSCHAPAYAWWTRHPHGNAYTTLETLHKQFNLSCVGCHVTGYGKPGGAAVVKNAGLTHVGCESCHGPGSKHAAQPGATTQALITKSPSEAACKQCHTPEHSDLFEYASYIARLRVPGHGLPPAPP
jgi:2',3'-cyclic-nucleotide 2'-phosphodiesterase (5'-nucleotidase family)